MKNKTLLTTALIIIAILSNFPSVSASLIMKEEWTQNMPEYIIAISPDGNYVASGSDRMNSSFHLFDKSGHALWNRYFDRGVESIVVLSSGETIVGDQKGTIYMFDLKGNLEWKFFVVDYGEISITTDAYGNQIYYSVYGKLGKLNKQGTLLWNISINENNWGISTKVSGDKFVVISSEPPSSNNWQITMYNGDGNRLWKKATLSPSSVDINSAGTDVVVGDWTNGSILHYDGTGKLINTIYVGKVTDIGITNNFIAATGDSGTSLADYNGKILNKISKPGLQIKISKDEKYIVVGSFAGISFYSIENSAPSTSTTNSQAAQTSTQKTPITTYTNLVPPLNSKALPQQDSTNWGLFGGILAVIAVGIVVFSMRRREHAPKPAPEKPIREATDILDSGNKVDDLQLKPIETVKVDKRDPLKVMSAKPDIISPTEKRPLESDDLKITRGYEVLENNDLRFGILVTNRSTYTVNDVDVHLKYDRSLFSLKGKEVISLGNITNNNPKTVTYILTPLVQCIHNSKISAIVSYKDARDNNFTVQMRPKEIHCISPFLGEKPMTEEQFTKLYESHSCHDEGIVFKGISTDALTTFIVDSAKNKRYVVKNSLVNGTHIIYLSSVAKDKTFYLNTVIIRSENNLTHVGLRACSNNEGGINNFINEILTSLRHYVNSIQSAREVENITTNISLQIVKSEENKKRNEQKELERMRKDAADKIRSAEFLLDKAKKLGVISLQKEDQLLNAASNFFDGNKYTDAINAAKQCEYDVQKLIDSSKPAISLELPQYMKYNTWKLHDIILINNGKIPAKNITIEFSKAFEIRDLKTIAQIDAGKKQNLRINIKPSENGDVPIDYLLKFFDLLDRKYELKNSTTIQIGAMQDAYEYSQNSSKKETSTDSLSGTVDAKTAFGYKGATIIYKVKIENDTDIPISEIKVYPYVPDVFLLKDKDRQISLIEPNKSQTVTFEIRPTGECGDCNVSGRIIYYNTASRKRQEIELEPKSLSIVCPILHRKEISEDAWSELVSGLVKAEEPTKDIPIESEGLFKIISEILKDMNLFALTPNTNKTQQIFRGTARFYGEGVKGLRYATAIEVIGRGKKSKLILKAWAEKEDSLTGFYHGLLDSINTRIDVKDYIDEPINNYYVHIGHNVGPGGKVIDIGDKNIDTNEINEANSEIGNTVGSAGKVIDVGDKAINKEKGNFKDNTFKSTNIQKCQSCGKEVQGNEKFCLSCGARL